MTDLLFRNFALLDVQAGRLRSGYQALVRGPRIARLERGRIDARGAQVIDCGGRTLMPGLIDCHLHICYRAKFTAYRVMLPSLVHANAADVLRGILLRGFTTARDAGGADLGHKQAVERGLFVGPRLFVSGRVLSQTGGHGDTRARSDQTPWGACIHLMNGGTRLADGVPEVLNAVRDEIRLGADHIKVMAGGGVTSPADPIDQVQYSTPELAAMVDEATRSGKYVLAHVYTADAVKRCVEVGIRTIEHGNMMDAEGARMLAKAGGYLVPTLIAYQSLKEQADRIGLSPVQRQKLDQVHAVGATSLELAKRAGVKMAYGSDCFHAGEPYQSQEFLVRADVLSPAEIIRSATLVGAEVVGRAGEIGVVRAGAYADLLVVDGNPLDDLSLFMGEGAQFAAIMKEGRFYKNSLTPTAADHPLARGGPVL